MLVYANPDHRLHDPAEPHRFGGVLLPPAETAARADRILSALTCLPAVDVRVPEPLDEQDLLLVHEPHYLEFLRAAHSRWRAATGAPADGEAVAYIRPLPGTPWRPPTHVDAQLGIYSNDVDPILEGTWLAARSAAASAVAAARAVHGGHDAAYAISRPPGHHAGPATFGGYCYLNNTALAAAWLASRGARVAVVDVDTHHGNGTQAVFWTRGDVLTVSIHGDPEVHFPFFTGFAEERGEDDGSGANLNLPLPSGSGWAQYAPALEKARRAVSTFGADVLVVALGVDTHVTDGVLALADEDYPLLGQALRTGMPTVIVQEGGYGEGVLEHAVPAVLAAFT
ncbi:MAG: histone deacetylase family protein [Acidimicrobiia bacterium]|nr:histone deacetylase family protein [Acidimicrobiia bacterium]